MVTTKRKPKDSSKTADKNITEPPYNVLLHNDWDNSMPRVVIVLKKVIPGMTVRRAMAIMWEAHTSGKATVKRCHKELAELYEERLISEGLTASIEKA